MSPDKLWLVPLKDPRARPAQGAPLVQSKIHRVTLVRLDYVHRPGRGMVYGMRCGSVYDVPWSRLALDLAKPDHPADPLTAQGDGYPAGLDLLARLMGADPNPVDLSLSARTPPEGFEPDRWTLTCATPPDVLWAWYPRDVPELAGVTDPRLALAAILRWELSPKPVKPPIEWTLTTKIPCLLEDLPESDLEALVDLVHRSTAGAAEWNGEMGWSIPPTNTRIVVGKNGAGAFTVRVTRNRGQDVDHFGDEVVDLLCAVYFALGFALSRRRE